MTKERSKRSYKRNEIIHAWIHKKEDAQKSYIIKIIDVLIIVSLV